MLLDWGPHFENHCSNLRDACFEIHPLLANLKMSFGLLTFLVFSIYLCPHTKSIVPSAPLPYSCRLSVNILPTLIYQFPLPETLPTWLGEALFPHHAQLICLVFWLPSLNSSINGISSYFTLILCGFLIVAFGHEQFLFESCLCLFLKCVILGKSLEFSEP